MAKESVSKRHFQRADDCCESVVANAELVFCEAFQGWFPISAYLSGLSVKQGGTADFDSSLSWTGSFCFIITMSS